MGDWHDVTVSLQWAPAPACALCGRPIFGQAWRPDAAEGQLEFCEPDCEVLYGEYWLPRYGTATVSED